MAYKCGATACKLFNYCAGGGITLSQTLTEIQIIML